MLEYGMKIINEIVSNIIYVEYPCSGLHTKKISHKGKFHDFVCFT